MDIDIHVKRQQGIPTELAKKIHPTCSVYSSIRKVPPRNIEDWDDLPPDITRPVKTASISSNLECYS